nr:glycosyltransferase 87 family protein [Microbacterium pseudoresistens]
MLPGQPMGDVVLVYEPWSTSAVTGGAVVGITEPWVYPHLALVPMLLAKGIAVLLAPLSALFGALSGSGAYLVAWALLVTLVDALGFLLLTGGRRSVARRSAAWFWLAALVLLGPVAMYRIDAITVPLAVMAGVWLISRPAVAAALLAAAAWMKIWPGAVLLAALALLRRRMRMLVAAALVTAGVIGLVALLGGGPFLLSFLTEQTSRGLQIEAVAATPFLWLAAAGRARIDYSYDILTFQIGAPGAGLVSTLLTPVMVVVVLALCVLAVRRLRDGADPLRLLPPTALALVVALIVCNKVGSPQFQVWLIAPVILWILYDRRRAGTAVTLVLVLCLLTLAVYPITYDALLRAQVLPIVLLTARNALLVALGIVAVRAMLRTPRQRSRRPA